MRGINALLKANILLQVEKLFEIYKRRVAATLTS